MKKKTKTVISLLIIIPVIIGLSVGTYIAGIYKNLEGKPSQLVWNENDKYNIDKDAYILTVDKKSDFKILNLTDLQLSEGMSQKRINRTYKLVRQLIQETNPSIVTFTGDNTWLKNSKKAVKRFVKEIDEICIEFDVPWAPILGNHDAESDVDGNWIFDEYLQAQNIIFNYKENVNRSKDLAKGPINISGVGNYVINVKSAIDDEIFHSMIMMDTHSLGSYSTIDSVNIGSEKINLTGLNESEKLKLNEWITKDGYIFAPSEDVNNNEYIAVGTGYDYIKENQIHWYEYMVNGLTEYNDAPVESTLFIHIPLPEYNMAAKIYEPINDGFTKDENGNFGMLREPICSPYYNSGMFEKIVELNSTKNVICGHEHKNNFSVLYRGVRLTYATKTGDGHDWVEDGSVCGGTVLEFDETEKLTVSPIYLNYDMLNN
jgi:hypothetical protein